ARHVEVCLGAGGLDLISVRDDGEGMAAEDALVAFARHATSKLARAEDLPAVTTLGFRGEALPSIAAVARVRLVTRRVADPGGGARAPRASCRSRRRRAATRSPASSPRRARRSPPRAWCGPTWPSAGREAGAGCATGSCCAPCSTATPRW